LKKNERADRVRRSMQIIIYILEKIKKYHYQTDGVLHFKNMGEQ